jgi:hypothetical protein
VMPSSGASSFSFLIGLGTIPHRRSSSRTAIFDEEVLFDTLRYN